MKAATAWPIPGHLSSRSGAQLEMIQLKTRWATRHVRARVFQCTAYFSRRCAISSEGGTPGAGGFGTRLKSARSNDLSLLPSSASDALRPSIRRISEKKTKKGPFSFLINKDQLSSEIKKNPPLQGKWSANYDHKCSELAKFILNRNP